MGQPDSSKHNKRAIYCEHARHGALRQELSKPISAAPFLFKKNLLRWTLSALLMFAIEVPARADKPCSGGDEVVARPIAAALQQNVSAFNPSGRFELNIKSSGAPTNDIYVVRHLVGRSELFRAMTGLQSLLYTAVVGRLPASEGLGFSIQVADGGSGYGEVCTYGFRFQNGVVSYRTLAASGRTRGGGKFAGDVTDWKPALTQAQQPPSPPTAAARPTRPTGQQARAARQLSLTTSVPLFRDASMPGEQFVLNPNLKYVASTLFDPNRPNDPSVRGRIRAWDAATGARIAEWPAHTATIQSLALSPRGDLLASSASDRSVTVWRVPEGRQIATWVDPAESIQSLSFDGSGTILVGSGSKVVRIWNAATGSLRTSIAKRDGATAVNPDGSLIASQDAVFEVRSGRVVRSIEVDGGSSCMAFSPDGRYFVLCQWDRIDLWDVSRWRLVWKFRRESRHVPFNALAFHPDGQHLAAALGDSIWLLELKTGEPVAFVPGSPRQPTTFLALGFAASDNTLVAATDSQLKRWAIDKAIVSAAPGRGAISVLEPNIVAAALGQSATNGRTLDLKVPRHVGIEVTFSVTPPWSGNSTFSWVIDGKPAGDGARIVRWLPPGQHKVELHEAGSYANSTPATIPAGLTPGRVARVDVNLKEEWDCLGRFGAGCNDKPIRNVAATTEVTVSVACGGKPDQVCVSSFMSVGAIKHDRCCQERENQRKAPGYRCDDGSDKEDQAVCAAEWNQAVLDSKLGSVIGGGPSAAIPRFRHTWVYPPDGTDAPSQGNKDWWQALADPGVIMSYSDSQPDKLEQSVCRAGTASRQKVVEMKNVEIKKLLVGPIFASKEYVWVCDDCKRLTGIEREHCEMSLTVPKK